MSQRQLGKEGVSQGCWYTEVIAGEEQERKPV